MKVRKRNIISFAICALFIAGLLAGSYYIKEGKQNAVSGYVAKEQGQIKWAYDTVSGDSNSPARNVHVVGEYQEGDFATDITKDIVIPDKVPECDSKGNIIAYHKVESLGDANVKNKDSFFFGSFNVTSSGIVVDATACTGLKTVNDWAFSADGYGNEMDGYGGRVDVYLPDSLEKIGTNCFYRNFIYCNSPNVILNGTDNTSSGFAFCGPATTPENSLQTTYKTKYRTNIPAILKDPDKFPYIGEQAKLVTFNLNDDSESGTFQGSGLRYDSVYMFLKNDESSRSFAKIHPPKREHYSFSGYYEGDEKIFDENGNLLKVPSGTELTAKWTPKVYTVIYRNTVNDKEITAKHVYGESFQMLDDISNNFYQQAGYTISHWKLFTTNDMHEEIQFIGTETNSATSIKQDMVFKAVLNPISYMVTYDAGDGKVAADDGSNNSQTSYSVPFGSNYRMPIASYAGHEFKGWYTSKTGGTEITSSTIMKQTKDHTLYAHWAIAKYKITFDANGGKGFMPPIEATINTKDIPKCDFTREGYSFDGWSYSKNGDTISDLSNITTNQTIYAIWKPNKYKVTFVSNGIKKQKTFIYDSQVEIPKAVNSEYEFAGWNTTNETVIPVKERNNNKIEFAPGTKKWSISKDITLYAVWYEKPTISIDVDYSDTQVFLNGKKVTNGKMSFNYGDTLNRVEIIANSNRYINVCKLNSSFLSDATILKDMSSRFEKELKDVLIKENLTLYIQLVNRSYPIEYDLQGGKIQGEYPEFYTYGTSTILPTEVKKDGAVFDGWKDTASNGVITSISKDRSGKITLQATYKDAEYHIYVDLAGGNYVDSIYKVPSVFKYKDADIILTQNVKKKGCVFNGWYCTEDNLIITKINASNARDVHIRAIWSQASTLDIASPVEKDEQAQPIDYVAEPMKSNQWYYNQLNDVEKKIYTSIYNYYKFDMSTGKCKIDNTVITTADKITYNNMMNASRAVCEDYPSIFWIRYFGHSSVTSSEDGTYSCGIFPVRSYNGLSFSGDALEYQGFWKGITATLDAQGIKTASVYKKLKLIHDYVVKTYSYRNETNILNANTDDETRSISYMMKSKEGCCESYAKMVKVLCDYYGIPCLTVQSVDHKWNQVQIDNKWYLVDATWDDANPMTYNYFLKGAASVTDVHHKKVESFFVSGVNLSTKEIKWNTEFACYPTPKLETKDYVIPVTPSPNKKPSVTPNKDTPKNTNPVTCATKKNVLYCILGKNAVVKKCKSKKVKSVTILNKVKIGKKTYTVTSIAKNAFKGCKKLKKVTIKAAKLKSIGKNAFKGIYKKATFKVPKKQLKKYKKLIQKKKTGFVKTMKVKK